jgi:hypothetical protein
MKRKVGYMAEHVTLNHLRAMEPGVERIRAIGTYIEQIEREIRKIRKLRDEDVLALISDFGRATAAQKSGLSPSTVKSISRGHH